MWLVSDDGGGRPVHDEAGIALLTLPEAWQQFLHIIPMYGHDGSLVADLCR